MKVWRCLAHDSDAPHRDARCWYAVAKLIDRSGFDPGPCRMVEMQLVPADARVVSGEAIVIEKVDGNWPPQALNYLAEAFMEAARQSNDGFIRSSERYRLAEFTLGALVSVSDPTKTAT